MENENRILSSVAQPPFERPVALRPILWNSLPFSALKKPNFQLHSTILLYTKGDFCQPPLKKTEKLKVGGDFGSSGRNRLRGL